MYISPKIRVIGTFKQENFYCEICNFPLVSNDDFESDEEFGCCNVCFLKFAESRRESWKNGWRPKKVDVNSYISIKRKFYSKSSKEK